MKRYSGYKDSSADWLGKVPQHWQRSTVRGLTKVVSERGRPDLPLLSVYRDYGVLMRTADDENHNVIPEDLTNYKVVRPNNLVLNKMKTWQGSLGISEFEGIVSPAYIVCELKGNNNPRFIHRLLRSNPYIFAWKRISYGVRVDQWDMRYIDFKQVPVFLPPREEQDAIVAFLEAKEAQINRFIANKRRMIELLKEQKAALINRAVTRGLNPNAPMKPSGVDWLGDIPTHWTIMKIGFLANILQTGPFGSQLHSSEYVCGGIPIINPSHMISGKVIPDEECAVTLDKWETLKRHAVEVGDIVLARRGELGRCALITEKEAGWLCGTGSMRMSPKRGFALSQYLVYAILLKGVARTLSLESVGSTMDNLNLSILSQLALPIPPLQEQEKIIEFIEGKECEFKHALDYCETEIALIEEYRATLIDAAVTGKIDVRRETASALEI